VTSQIVASESESKRKMKVISRRLGPATRWRFAAAAVCLLLGALVPQAYAAHSQTWAQDQFEAAERARQALESKAESDRTRRDYERAVDAYRRVYYGAPTSSKAEASVAGAAGLLLDEGRRFQDNKALEAAIEEYEFLRREYPGSKRRVDALLTIGQVYKDDLDDPTQARVKFEELLHRYPHSPQAAEAKQSLKQLKLAEARAQTAPTTARPLSSKTAKPGPAALAVSTSASVAASAPASAADDDTAAPPADDTDGKPAQVTGIEHWSSGGYTVVAIDLERPVRYESQRIENPDRIFFDFAHTHLASTLVGKPIEVNDGFLKRIRAAQYQQSQTRVVLELDSVSEYRIIAQTSPPRLMIQLSQGRAQPAADTAAKLPGEIDIPPSPATSGLGPAASGVAPAKTAALHSQTSQPSSAPVVRKRIVEADDVAPSPAGASQRHKTAAGVSDSEETAPDPVAAVSAKRKSPDGNNDEIATLDPASIPVAPAPTRHATSTSAATKGVRKTKPGIAVDAGHEAQPTSSGDRSLTRVLGLKIGRIVIDAGHGGHDTGTVGPHGLLEKDLVLDVAKRLGSLLEARMGAEVVYTRDDDTFIPLETRTAIANQQHADLFVSIHANSSPDPAARGVETYYLNFTSSSDALEVAARENAASEKSIYELQDLVKKIALKEKIEESREFAADVENSLHAGLAAKSPAIRDRGVKKAPFVVLIGANMPSILTEISFVSNPTDEHKLNTPEQRQRIADSLYKGIAHYVGGLSGVKLASRETRSQGQ
jgi:N-acetylmuramoyl-L-alanine amidase